MTEKIYKLANKLNGIGQTDLSEELCFVASIMDRKRKSPISKQNLIVFRETLLDMAENNPDAGNREYAKNKLMEYEPIFRKYLPEIYQEQLFIGEE